MKTFTLKQVQKREENDDHLTTEERVQFLTQNNIEFTEENIDEIFVDFIF